MRAVRVWIDLTNSPHVLVMRPVIELLRADGHDVTVTARDFSQTLELLERHRIEHVAIGAHRGGALAAKGVGLLARSAALLRFAHGHARPAGAHGRSWRRPFDVALGHGSNDISVAATLLGIPSSTMFDYEWAALQHHINCRLARSVVVPAAIPPERLYRYGARGKIRAYDGLKEEYYLADFQPSPGVLAELGLDPSRRLVVLRTPPDVALYHRFANELFEGVLERLLTAARARSLQVVALPRTAAQRERLAALTGLTVPTHAVDAQTLVAGATLVISAGGTMNREAAALGTPVLSTFQGRLGAVDERLLAEGRMQRLERPEDLDAPLHEARRPSAAPVRRDPRRLVELLLSAVREPNASRASTGTRE
ncbi:MAG: DUF354 domain-containing protein [Solirubrobacteraceae bacterium]